MCRDKGPVLWALSTAQVWGGCQGGIDVARLEVSSLQEYLQLFYMSSSQEDLRLGLRIYSTYVLQSGLVVLTTLVCAVINNCFVAENNSL